MIESDFFWGIRCVWLRYFDVFRKSLLYYITSTFLEPILYLFSFGFGVGTLIGQLSIEGHTVSYRSFIFSGILGQTVLFQGFFEAAYGGFIRMYFQKIFHAMATTPITLSEVLWGELIWDATKATLATMVVAIIGIVSGDFRLISLILIIPFGFMTSLLFESFGLMVAAFSKTIEEISYPQYLVVFPMFLFCGIFYPIENLPMVVQWIAWALPLTSVVSLFRSITLGFSVDLKAIPILTFWLIFFLWLSRRSMMKRLVK